jgi:hypothetical protein
MPLIPSRSNEMKTPKFLGFLGIFNYTVCLKVVNILDKNRKFYTIKYGQH